MKKLGEQWVEDGRMYKAVLDNKNLGLAEKIGYAEESKHLIWKIDLGPVNGEGLLPCPFCGEFPELQDNRNGSYWYRCQNCGCALSTSDSIKDAKDNSNRRHT